MTKATVIHVGGGLSISCGEMRLELNELNVLVIRLDNIIEHIDDQELDDLYAILCARKNSGFRNNVLEVIKDEKNN